eukprot:m.187638 g.187638  ORF g.187638 m.187638 type:complete len:51 (+) comp15611_c0_seq4:429-581(+)
MAVASMPNPEIIVLLFTSQKHDSEASSKIPVLPGVYKVKWDRDIIILQGS